MKYEHICQELVDKIDELEEKVERYEKALNQIAFDMEYGDYEWSVITTIYENVAEEALKG